MEPATLTVEQTAELLGIGRQLAYQLVREGRIPVLRLGARRWVVPRSALNRMLHEQSSAEEAEGDLR